MNTQPEFPKLPEVQATWAPVYIEPIMHSGEKITVGVAAISNSGDVMVLPTLSAEKLKCAFGENGLSLIEAANVCLEELSEYLKDHNSFDWDAPFSGVTLGPTRKAAGNDLNEVVNSAMQMTASFSKLILSGDLKSLAEGIGEEDRWPKQIKDAVEHRAPKLINNFSRTFNLVPGGRPTDFDYWGERYIANFGKVATPAKALREGRAKLWSLARLREIPIMKDFGKYELILWRPPEDYPAFTEKQMKNIEETVLELTEEAKKEELTTVPVLSADQASEHLIQMEAA